MAASQVALVVKKPPVNAGDAVATGTTPGSGRFYHSPLPVENSIPLQSSCLENFMGREA